MAKLIPVRHSCLSRMTSGEKRFSERLEQKLEDDYLLWYDVPLGRKQRRPDFTIFHPGRGLLVLEVKDWRIDSLHAIDRHSATLLTDQGLKTVENPLLQARIYVLEICVVLEKDPQLRHPAGHRHAGKLIMPWGYGVVLSNITRRQFEENQLGEVIAEHLVICADEMYESVDAEAFQERLWAMFGHVFACRLTLPQIDRIRWHMFPDIRPPTPGTLFADDDPQAPIPDVIAVMDREQERFARSLGEGHRIVHGVAGSGKTMILGYRCLHMARVLHKPTLVLCFNRTLAARLEQLMTAKGLDDKVSVRSFHRWCRDMLITYHVALPAQGEGYADELVVRVMDAVERGRIPRAQYGAVLIDEGHDFEPDWYRIVLQMIDPVTNSLLVLYDDAQNIYRGRSRLAFTWKEVGIQASGRTMILKINYRNTLDILMVAQTFAGALLAGREADDEGIPIVAPQSQGRRGAFPELLRVEREDDELDLLVRTLREELGHGRHASDIAILFRANADGKRIHAALERAGIESRLADQAGKSALFDGSDAVKIISMHSSKGLEFPLVLIPFVGRLPAAHHDEAEEARLFYIAMTRATARLMLIHSRDSAFTRRLRTSMDEVTRTLATA